MLSASVSVASEDDPTENDAAVNDPAVNDPAVNDPAVNDPAVNDPAVNDPAVNDPAVNDAADGAQDVVGRIDRPGLLALVGVTHTDTVDTARAMAGKLHELRILRGDLSCASTGAPLLVVSQFTLYARTDKGRRPSWDLAAPRDRAEPLVDEVVAELRRRGAEVARRPVRRDDAGRERQRRPVHGHPRSLRTRPPAAATATTVRCDVSHRCRH